MSLFPIFGTAIAVAGADKLGNARGYRGLDRQLRWSHRATRAAGLAEMIGGLLMVPRATRGFGAALVATTSAALLVREIEGRELSLAAPRGVVLLGALAALVSRRAAR